MSEQPEKWPNRILTQTVTTPVGALIVGDFDGALALCDWRDRSARPAIDKRLRHGLNARFAEAETELTARVRSDLTAYFAGQLRAFDWPLRMIGTEFQQKVWQILRRIPYGATWSYGQLAEVLENPNAVRAVAAANAANALSIVVPCHRVIGQRGKLTGYAGGLAAKHTLLRLERTGRVQNSPLQRRLFD